MSIVFKRLKICIFGDGGVGKTTLTHRFLTGVFQDHYDLTIGMDFFVKKIEINELLLSLQIWDFAGEEKFRFLLPSALYGAHGVIFMYDITRFLTFKNLNNWLTVINEALQENNLEIPAVLVGSKIDLQDRRAVSLDNAIAYSNENNFKQYLECSSKTGENVELVFQTLGQIIFDKLNLLEQMV